jgi:hypothetical protein
MIISISAPHLLPTLCQQPCSNSSNVLNSRVLANATGRQISFIRDIPDNSPPALINITNLSGAEPIKFLPTIGIEVNGERPRDEEPSQRHSHSDVVGTVIGGETSQGRKQSATTDGGNDPR